MKYTFENKSNVVTVSFSVTPSEFEGFMEKAYNQNKSQYSVQGFRKGHVPRKVLENTYGTDLFFEDALIECASVYYVEFLDKNKKVVPVSRPTLDDKAVKQTEKEVTFAVSFAVKPEVELGQYTGLEVEKAKVEPVTDEEVNEELKRVQERNARFVDVTDRAVQNGDSLNLNYSGSVDGVKFDGGTAEDQNLEIGSHSFIEGFEEQLVGLSIGDEKAITVTFPTEYHAEELAGKEAVFEVKINAITQKELPEIDDELAKDVSEFETLAEYKEDIKKNLTESREKEASYQDENKLVELIVANAKMEVPNEMVEDQISDLVDDFSYQLGYQGLKLEDYFKYTGSTMEEMRESHRERAVSAVNTRLVFEAIIEKEKLKVDKKTVNKKIKEYAVQYGQDAKTFEESLEPNQVAYFENQVLTEKLIDFLKEQNNLA